MALIEINRTKVPGQLACGWHSGLYWRSVRGRDVSVYGADTSHSVYIQVLVPAVADICDDAWGIRVSAPYDHAEPGSDDTGTCLIYSVDAEEELFPQQSRLHWVEAGYGRQHIVRYSRVMITASLHSGWYPLNIGRPQVAEVVVLPEIFLKYIQPSAEYMCRELQRYIAENVKPAS